MYLCKGPVRRPARQRDEILAFHRRLIDFRYHCGPIARLPGRPVRHPPKPCYWLARMPGQAHAPCMRLPARSTSFVDDGNRKLSFAPVPKGEARRLKISVVVPMLNEERGVGPP